MDFGGSSPGLGLAHFPRKRFLNVKHSHSWAGRPETNDYRARKSSTQEASDGFAVGITEFGLAVGVHADLETAFMNGAVVVAAQGDQIAQLCLGGV